MNIMEKAKDLFDNRTGYMTWNEIESKRIQLERAQEAGISLVGD